MHNEIIAVICAVIAALCFVVFCLRSMENITNRDVSIVALSLLYGSSASILIVATGNKYESMLQIGLVVGGLSLLVLDSFKIVRRWFNKKASWLYWHRKNT